VTDKNGDDQKRDCDHVIFRNLSIQHPKIPDYIEHATTKVALGNLFLQREIEQSVERAREEHTKLIVMLEELEARALKVSAPPLPKSAPPAVATFLLAFIAPKNTVQAFLGDLEEIFHKNAASLGERQARRQYWMQVFASIGPLAWQWLKRVGFFTVLIDYFRSKLGF
jgi:hypothetical protein